MVVNKTDAPEKVIHEERILKKAPGADFRGRETNRKNHDMFIYFALDSVRVGTCQPIGHNYF